MRHVLGPIREEPDREGEDEWIIAAAETVINSVSFKQFNQVAEKRLTKWYSGEGVGTIAGQDSVIQDARDPIKFYVRAAERKLSPRFPHQMTRNYCVPIVSAFPFQASEPELKVSFSNRPTRGIAFVEMSTQWETRRAVSMLNRRKEQYE
jgi:hypothetical protein